jgi:hypothetical protein
MEKKQSQIVLAVEIELHKSLADVPFHRIRRHIQPSSDLPIGIAQAG